MKVFAIKAYGHYGGGMAIVAAPDAETARALAAGAEDSMWHVDYQVPESIEELKLEATEAGVLAHFETGE